MALYPAIKHGDGKFTPLGNLQRRLRRGVVEQKVLGLHVAVGKPAAQAPPKNVSEALKTRNCGCICQNQTPLASPPKSCQAMQPPIYLASHTSIRDE